MRRYLKKRWLNKREEAGSVCGNRSSAKSYTVNS